MPIENNPQYIDDLNPSYPQETDPLSQADDHIKHIKTVLKQTFPNIDGQVTATQADLNEAMVVPAMLGTGGNVTLNTGITQDDIKTAVGITDPAITTDGSSPSLASFITAEEIRTLIGAQASANSIGLSDVYPVGSVYLSVDASFNPSTTFGGTWVAFGSGRMLLGIDPNNNTIMNTEMAVPSLETTLDDDSYTKTLSASNIPAHRHGINLRIEGSSNTNGAIVDSSVNTTVSSGSYSVSTGNTDQGHAGYQSTLSTQTDSTGSGDAFDIMPPYITVAMWKRTA